jgi:putative two-component system response regulator
MDGTQDEERGLERGAVDYITKPIRPSIVLARVRTQLEIKRARDVLPTRTASWKPKSPAGWVKTS